MKKILSSFLACAGFCSFAWAQPAESAPAPTTVATSAPSTRPGPKPGELVPDFTVVGPDGKEIKLSDFRGKTVLIDIWATWCGPCIASMPHNSELAEKYAKDGLVILAICADDSRANYDGWVKRNASKYKFLTAHDTPGKDGWDKSIFNTGYGVSGFPTLFLVSPEGKLIGTTGGGGPGENPHVTRLLAKSGLPIDTSHLPPEEKNRPASIPMVGKTPAMAAGSRTAAASGNSGAMRPPIAQLGSLKMDDPVEDFSAIGVDGKEVKLSSFKGKPVLVAFWTGARAPSDDIAKLYQNYRDQGLAVWAINVATERAEFATWAKANAAALGYTVAWDPAGKAFMEAASYMKFGIGMYPAFFVVNAEGNFRGGLIGMGAKIPAWMRLSLLVSGIKLTAEDKAAVDKAVQEHIAASRAESAGGMLPAGRIVPSPAPSAAEAAAAAKRPATLGAGAIAPDFVMHDVAGKEVRLSDFKDKVVILDFWATWCGPCIASFPHTQNVAAKYKDQGVVVVASGTSDTIAKFKEWIPKNQPKYPDLQFFFDPNARGTDTFEERASAKLYGVVGIPTQFVIGRDGKIIATIVGNGGDGDARTEAALAKAGVKVEAALVAQGEKQLADADAREKQRAADTADAEKNPRAPFYEDFGRVKAGALVPEAELLKPDGTPTKLSELAKGRVTVVGVWSGGNGPGDGYLADWKSWGAKYPDVAFVGVGGYASLEDVVAWQTANAGKISFTLVADPAGKAPRADKDLAEMTDDEKAAFRKASSEHYQNVFTVKLAGLMTPVPSTVVIDATGKLVGWSAGYGARYGETLGNLLLRAGVKLAASDMPSKVWTAEETKPKAPEPRVESLKIGAQAPDFTTQTLDGKDVKLSDFRGKVVILDFWATWCGPCMAAMPHTQEVAAKYKDQGVVTLGSCTSDTRDKFEAWVKANQEKYPDILWSHDKNERGADRASNKLYGVRGIPTQFIIDREGKVVDIVIGYLKGEAILDAALAKAGVKVDPALVEKGAADLKRRG